MTEVERFRTPELDRLGIALAKAERDIIAQRAEYRAAEAARMRDLEAAHPESLFPCGRSHACRSCSPNRVVQGTGCLNCRQTGWDQTPCVPCRDAIDARRTAG